MLGPLLVATNMEPSAREAMLVGKDNPEAKVVTRKRL